MIEGPENRLQGDPHPDWPPMNITIVEKEIGMDHKEVVYEKSHEIWKGDWVEFVGEEDPFAGKFPGMKGVVVERERLDYQQYPRKVGTYEMSSEFAFPVKWIKYADPSITMENRHTTKPAGAFTVKEESQEVHIMEEHQHLHTTHNHYPEAPLINIQDSVITDSTITARKEVK